MRKRLLDLSPFRSQAQSFPVTAKEAHMKRTHYAFASFILAILPGSYLALAQQNASRQHAMNFFVTSVGIGKGGNLGGLVGADAHCQALASAVGAGSHPWHAYVSTQAKDGQPAVNARDRIGQGPWYNAKGEMIAHDLAELHGDTIELARLGSNLNKLTALTEKGEIVPGLSENPKCPGPGCNEHEMLTGSQPDGRAFTDNWDHTCSNWTSSTDYIAPGTNSWEEAQTGFSDRNGGGNGNWNSAHPTRGCSQQALLSTHSAGRYYCFAAN
jgi:hypothetical protein